MSNALVGVLREAAKILPIKTVDGQDYAEAHGTDFQAMTVRPSSFDALNSLPLAIDLIERLTVENERLRKAIGYADEIITESWGEDQMERGDCQAVNILRAALADGGGE